MLKALGRIVEKKEYTDEEVKNMTWQLTNGADCIIKNIDYRVEKSSRPSIIWVSFLDIDIGRKQRKENAHLYNKKNINKNWTPILEITRQFRINKKTSTNYPQTIPIEACSC